MMVTAISKSFSSIKNDLKNLSRDPMIFFMLFLPVLTTTIYMLVESIGVDLLLSELAFDAKPYLPYMLFLFSMLPSYFFGFVFALIIIDEKDQGLLDFFMVTPGGINTVFTARIVFVLCFSFISNFALLFLSSSELSPELLISGGMGAFLGPFFIVMLPVLASNKVEAMAVSKLTGLFLLAPFAALLDSPVILYISMLSPTYWIGQVFFETIYLPFGILGFLITTAGWITFFIHFFRKKMFKLS